MQKWLSFTLLAAVLLAACTAAPPAAVAPTFDTNAVVATALSQTQTAGAPTVAPSQVVPTLEIKATGPATCSVDTTTLPAVSKSDWSEGPEDAKITILEYSDFQ
jgi:hypothetical protein